MIVNVNLRKREEDGVINPVREKWNCRFGIAILIGIAAIFVYLLVWGMYRLFDMELRLRFLPMI